MLLIYLYSFLNLEAAANLFFSAYDAYINIVYPNNYYPESAIVKRTDSGV